MAECKIKVMKGMVLEKKICSGCGACEEGCPHQSITMTLDSEGFRYPIIDPEKCVSCKKCERVCPVLNPPSISENTIALAAKNTDIEVRKRSSSGGVFSALAERVLARGGIVCAAVFDENQAVNHVIVESYDGIEAMRGAKYVQSVTEQCFKIIKEALIEDRSVLFVGTPCQTAGLYKFLGKKYESLILIDMICHGVPSPKVWDRYLQERKKTDVRDVSIDKINLRCKDSGWTKYSYSVQIQYKNGEEYRLPQGKDVFMQGFIRNLYLRPSCSHCGFKGIERCSDLTLGDCWGIWDIAPEFDDNQGTSLLLIHSATGQKIWEEISPKFASLELSPEEAVSQNPSALQSSAPHENRDRFFERLDDCPSVSSLIQECLFLQEKKSLLQRIKDRFRI